MPRTLGRLLHQRSVRATASPASGWPLAADPGQATAQEIARITPFSFGLLPTIPSHQTSVAGKSVHRSADRKPATGGAPAFAAGCTIRPMIPSVLVCRTAWMDFYDGLGSGDAPVGGGAYVDESGFGHEIFNFRAEEGWYRGYVRPVTPRRGVANQRINIGRLGAAAGDEAIDGVTVFWVATDRQRGGTRVVGWYEDARVFRAWQSSPKPRLLPNGDDAGFMIEARHARLLPPDDRLFLVPRATSKVRGIGQSNVWYVPDEFAPKLLEYRGRVEAGVLAPPPKAPVGPARLLDTEKRLRVERTAMKAASEWCIARGLEPRDVSLAKLGWDIEAGVGGELLRIEVKGTSLAVGTALLDLTANEFARMSAPEIIGSYRVAVVQVSDNDSKLSMFAWSHERAAWVADTGSLQLVLHPVTAARIEVRRTR